MAVHTMTPARKAALRKAQLASAAKRRKGGVAATARHVFVQKAGYAKASAQVSLNGRKPASVHPRAKKFAKKAGKAALYTAAVAAPLALTIAHSELSKNGNARKIRQETKATAAGKYSAHGIKKVKSTRGPGMSLHTPPRALTTGPKGKATLRQRNYRARQNQKAARAAVGKHFHSQGMRTASEIAASRAHKKRVS